ncbi:sensor histidine kinase [Micromonospora sp. KC723]|uniref:sensor histidine kinase n=1 Tax=Micromonospora sp. KC723 TaxID=2530381 RepID=UPI001047F2CF|nr:hypothetical protein [Micromonospora sp. KC723]TDB76425.1 hypothetical protein E1165_07190 [Micromonospora sp. KC723]
MGDLGRWRRVARARPALSDALLATALLLVSLLPVGLSGGASRGLSTAGAVLLAVVGCAAVALRHRYPLPVLVVAVGAVLLGQFTALAWGPFVLVVAVAAYTVLRGRGRPAGTGAPPTPSLTRLDALVEAGGSGRPVRWTVAGQPRPLPVAVDETAYRIIEVSLADADRYAPGAAVVVRLRYDPDGVTVEVRDGGVSRPTPPLGAAGLRAEGGHGLVGLRERAETFGGTLAAGPCPDGGWLVRAALPAPEEQAG